MDLDTENRLAALLMEEARRLRAEAEKDGVHVYLRQPKERGRPNSRFLTATILGVQQANRSVEVNEMWRAREKELELVTRSRNKATDRRDMHHNAERYRSRHEKARESSPSFLSSSKNTSEDNYTEGDGLRDEDVEKFLHSRAKRGRGAVGSRMDEPGPYPASTSDQNGTISERSDVRIVEEWEQRVLGPEWPASTKFHQPIKDIALDIKRVRKEDTGSSKKSHHHKKHRLKEKERKKSRKEKSWKHYDSS